VSDLDKLYPVRVIDADNGWIVQRCKDAKEAAWFLGYLAEHGGNYIRAKVEYNGYRIERAAK
jgi:hypothetical protein